ncbi:MAG: hypothetical protein P8H13_02250 [Polaribacter sp.]|nr:hypothetical protein [Polaribacter sp.]MDG1810743.1 hypothetical protein [Polaribacter sp.]
MKKKTSTLKVVVNFFTQLIIGLLLVFCAHTYVLETKNVPVYDAKIILAYFANGLLAITIFLVLFFLRKKQRDQLGFLFMFGSFLKFGVFFIFFYPFYNADNTMSRVEFMAFFIPYIYSLFIETLALIRLLNLPEKSE